MSAGSARQRAASVKVAVIGAGAFGGWTALTLLRRGAQVTLVDAWGAGNARSSSGGETRVIRATYGSQAIYTAMAARALQLWREFGAPSSGLLRTTGVLWMFGDDDAFGRASAATLRDADLAVEELSPRAAAARFAQIAFDGVAAAIWEPDAGYLFARRACQSVVERFIAEGGNYRTAVVASPVAVPASRVTLGAGETIDADVFVFACGPWLAPLFPDVIGPSLSVTRQEVYYFGSPEGDPRFEDPAMPVWLDCRERVMYGIPGNGGRGFKIADDTSGPTFDPTGGDRGLTAAGAASTRAFLARRFPGLAKAPLLGGEVCQYESTPDSHFIIDRHPAAANVWIAGGGSGHGFKMGPAVGELLAACILDGAVPDSRLSLSRFGHPPANGWERKWS